MEVPAVLTRPGITRACGRCWTVSVSELFEDRATQLRVAEQRASFYLAPTKPDYISTCGLKFLREFKERDPQMGFAENLGVIST
jgi:hypothetical protein